jgi:cold-inducible RNA-binding protein
MTSAELTQVLSEAGQVVDVYIPTDRESGRPRGFAFATFSSEKEAAEAIRLFNQRDVGGRRLNVNAAEERPRRPPGPGGFGGGDRGGVPGGRPPFRPGGGYGGGGARPGFGGPGFNAAPPPGEDLSGFDGGRYTPDDEGGAPAGGGDTGDPPKRFKGKGSRRGLRARKRSL